ncbi:NACHT domain-containing protein [Streptomyces lomondensis]|uniref:ATP-binding protein n=1 Tax=Streptomyces lomondensis TaxID=68229 RepID=A0ABQ2XDB6_9ACTN|nr:NACHT domain-containing protein [Streptomyces lomondensis]MCF0077865.1 NACHT domain-containing protein [Streptomyces lomondensis]GGX11865.1 ATP-binding protein [Streptomyces lomondensis]
MDPTVLGGKLASALVAPLLKKLFRAEGPGAGLVDKPVRLSALVSFRGEKRTLTEPDVHRLAGRIVAQAVDSPGEPPFPADEQTAVTDTLARRLLAIGDLDMDDVQAVRLGHRELAKRLHYAAPPPDGLSTDSCHFLDHATEWACLNILEFFTRRSTFVARTLIEQTRAQAELIAKVDELITRTPRPGSRDAAFERRYLPYVAERHNHITIYGIDLRDSPDRWPLEVAYLSLEATSGEETAAADAPPGEHTGAATVRLPAEEALGSHDRVLLRGDAGSGKTTLVQWLAVTAARDGARIPFVLPLRTLIRADSLPTPSGFLTAVSCPLTPPEGWAERVLTAGRGLVLVDGLDEIPAADRHRTRDWLLALIHAFPGNHWLLTSRPTAVRPDWLAGEGFRELTLTPMRRADVRTFVHRWHAAARAPEYETQLLDSLRTKRDLARLATNPLMCGLICALHRERRGYLPTGRKELYDAALGMLLARRDRERGMGSVDGAELGEEAQLEVLQRLAYALVLSGRTEMDLETAEDIVARCLPVIAPASGQGDAGALLRTLLLRSGLLRQPGEGVVDFVHRTFQDYLGARYAVEEGHLGVLAGHADDSLWEDVIRMAVAHARPRERATLLRRLLAADTPRLTLLALACLEHAAALDPGVRAEVEERAGTLIPPRTTPEARALAEAGPLVLELLPGPEGLTAQEAHGVVVTASLLGAEEDQSALAVLRRFREHPDLDVRRQIAGTWSRFDTHEFAVDVLDHLERDDLTVVCESAEQRAMLHLMRPWANLRFDGPLTAAELLDCVPEPAEVRFLDLRNNPSLGYLGELQAAFPSLTGLWLQRCPGTFGLSRLAELPLTDLVVFDRGADFTGLGKLNKLTLLSIDGNVPGDCLADTLPADAPLRRLFLGMDSIHSTGLRGLARWPTLQSLTFGVSGRTPLSAEDWSEVAALPALTALSLYGQPEGYAQGAVPELPGVRSLQFLVEPPPPESLRLLASRLPGLRTLGVSKLDSEEFLAPYAEIFPTAEIIRI